MTDLARLLFFAAMGYGLARWLRLPLIPILLLCGIVLSFSGMTPSMEFTQNAVELGLTFLVFVSGVELNPRRFGKQLGAVLWVGALQFLVAGGVGFCVAVLLDFSVSVSLYIAFAMATSSTLVVVRQLRQQQQTFEPFGRVVIGVLLVQDLLMILVIIVLSRVGDGPVQVVLGLGDGLLLAALAFAGHRWIMPKVIVRMKLDQETILLVVLAVLFAFVGLAFHLNIPAVAGGFFAGIALSAFPVNGVVRGLLTSLSDFFLALFFTALGAVITMPSSMMLLKAAAFALMVVLVTPPLVTAIAEWRGLSSRAAIEGGLLLAQTSEFSLLLGLTGLMIGILDQEVFSMIAIVTVATMMLTPFLATDRVTRVLLHLHPLRRRMSTETRHENHILVLGFGAGGMWVVKPLLSHGHDVLVIDDDPVIIEQLQRSKIACVRGDGSDEKVLARAGARRAKLIIASMRRVSEAEKVFACVKDIPVVVRVFEEKDAEHIRRLGGVPILNSEAAANTFMEWYEKAFGDSKPA